MRLGFLVPPGNPTVEPEMYRLAPEGVTVHFSRLLARGPAGAAEGLDERTRSQLAHIDAAVELLAMVSPAVIALAHTASSYHLGKDREAELVARMESLASCRFVTAFGSVVAALRSRGVRRVALGTPYTDAMTKDAVVALQDHGFEVVRHANLSGVKNIYLETAERAAMLAREVDSEQAEAVFLSGVGMPTIAALPALQRDLNKTVVSSASAMMWNALRVAGFGSATSAYECPWTGRTPGAGRLDANNQTETKS